MSLSHIVATICLILDGVLIVVLLGGLRRPAVPAAAVPPRARRWLRLVLGVQAVFAIFNVAALVLLLLRGVEIVPSGVWSVLVTLFFLLVVTATRLARAGRIV
jgi:hypothetical protein